MEKLTIILIKDPVSSRWTAFFEECPQAVGEGETKEEAAHSATGALVALLAKDGNVTGGTVHQN